MKQLFYFILFLLFTVVSYGATPVVNNTKADCVILKDENSIICKYSHKRLKTQRTVKFNWIEPDGKISRTRDMIIPAGHGSVYDYRYIKGRTKGKWTFEVIDGTEKAYTNFTLE